MHKRRVVITGMGMVTPLATDLQTTWRKILKSESGIRRITLFDISTFLCKIGGEVSNFSIYLYIEDDQWVKLMNRGLQFGVASAKMAMDCAGLKKGDYDPLRCGVSLGCGGEQYNLESLSEWHREFKDSSYGKIPSVDPIYFIRRSFNIGSTLIAIFYNAQGPNISINTACASSTQAIGTAYKIIQQGKVDVMITGGYDSMISEIGIIGFSLLGALSTKNDEPTKASRPFDRTRDGFVLGEGAGILILEELSHAMNRKAKIYGEVVGYGTSMDAYRITDSPPDGRGAILSMKRALEDAKLMPTEVDYINAHGTSTQDNDRSETLAIKQIFGEYAYQLPISSTKSMTAHLIAATGAVELIFCILSIRDGIIPPTVNYEFKDPNCDLDYVPNSPRESNVNVALSNSFAFGGNNATLVVKKV